MAVFLGIDIGTSGTKTLAIDEAGKILADATELYPSYHPKPLWSEQDPEDWWQATVKTVRAVVKKAKLKPADVKAIGLSGQMHGSVFLDKNNKVIRRALLWNDQRTAAECDEIERRAGGRRELIQMVANPALTGFTAPKILWLRNNEPKNFDKTVKVLLPKDDIRRRLTGEFATDVSDASGMLLLDVAKRDWSKPLLSTSWSSTRACSAAATNRRKSPASSPRETAARAGPHDRLRRRRRRRRLRGRRRRQRHRQPRHAQHVDRHLRRHVRPQRRRADRSRRPAAHVLPRRPRQVAHDGRQPLGRRLAAVVPQQLCQAEVAAAKKKEVERLRHAHQRGRRRPARQRGAVLPAVPLRRAHAARRSRRPRRASSA